MPLFKYKAISRDGRTVRGRMEASNPADLELRMNKLELELVSHTEANSRSGAASRQKITRRDLITFCYHMEQLSRSGVPLIDGLIDLRDSLDNAAFREVIAGVIQSIESGKTLSAALGDYPKVFDMVFTQLIRAGEESGKLPDVLLNITDNLKWQDELAAQTTKILIYPLFVGVVVLAVVTFLMIYLVPKLVSFITMTGGEIPLHTRALIATSDVFINQWYLIFSLPLIAYFTITAAAKRSENVRTALDGFKLRIWIVGPILRKIILTRFTNYFALLYASGITVVDCMDITEKITGNRVIMNAMAYARQKINEGNSLSSAMDSVGLFPPLVVRMFRVGESTGALDSALRNISYFYNRDVNESIGKAQTMIGPALTVVLGLLVAWIMFSVFGPIYEVMSKIKG